MSFPPNANSTKCWKHASVHSWSCECRHNNTTGSLHTHCIVSTPSHFLHVTLIPLHAFLMRRFIVKLLLIEPLLRNSGKIHVCQTDLHPADWGRRRGVCVCVCRSAAGRWPFSYYQSNHDIPVAWRCWYWWPLNTKYGAHTARCKHTPAFCESSSPLKVVGWKLRGKCKRSRWKREKPSVRMLSAHFPWSDSSNWKVVSQGFKLEARHFLASCCCYKISWNSECASRPCSHQDRTDPPLNGFTAAVCFAPEQPNESQPAKCDLPEVQVWIHLYCKKGKGGASSL